MSGARPVDERLPGDSYQTPRPLARAIVERLAESLPAAPLQDLDSGPAVIRIESVRHAFVGLDDVAPPDATRVTVVPHWAEPGSSSEDVLNAMREKLLDVAPPRSADLDDAAFEERATFGREARRAELERSAGLACDCRAHEVYGTESQRGHSPQCSVHEARLARLALLQKRCTCGPERKRANDHLERCPVTTGSYAAFVGMRRVVPGWRSGAPDGATFRIAIRGRAFGVEVGALHALLARDVRGEVGSRYWNQPPPFWKPARVEAWLSTWRWLP